PGRDHVRGHPLRSCEQAYCAPRHEPDRSRRPVANRRCVRNAFDTRTSRDIPRLRGTRGAASPRRPLTPLRRLNANPFRDTMRTSTPTAFNSSLSVLAASILAACGGSGSSPTPPAAQAGVTINGIVTATHFTPGSATDPTIAGAYYQGAKVCVDANGNGVCDASENPVTTDANGKFTLTVPANAALIADIGTTATNTASGASVASRDVLRASLDQVIEQAGGVVISPLSSE